MSGGEAFPGVSRSGCRCAIKRLLSARYDWRAELPKRMQFRHWGWLVIAPTTPPITGRTRPVMYEPVTGDARKTYAGATSSGCAGRRNAVLLPNSLIFSPGRSAGFSGVHVGPGATAFTRMPRSARFVASAIVKALSAPFVAE